MSQKSQLRWRHEDVIHVTELYKDNVCLRQVHHHLDKNRNTSDVAVMQILACLKKQVLDKASSDIKNKLHILLSQHQREVKLMNSTESNAGAEEINKSKFWCFHL